MESVFVYVFLMGALLALIGAAWLLVAAGKVRWTWIPALLLFPPVLFWFLYRHQRAAALPAAVLAVGLFLLVLPAAYTRLAPIDLGPYEDIVNGERHLTLTGWDRTDYRVIQRKMDTVVLQMANADVTDETLSLLTGMPNLRELDVSHSQVTDNGLAHLAELPLQTLRLMNCPQVTDAGFRAVLVEHPSLKEVDVRGTQISAEAIREWRKADRTRRAMQGELPAAGSAATGD
jgi:hypothetical protein